MSFLGPASPRVRARPTEAACTREQDRPGWRGDSAPSRGSLRTPPPARTQPAEAPRPHRRPAGSVESRSLPAGTASSASCPELVRRGSGPAAAPGQPESAREGASRESGGRATERPLGQRGEADGVPLCASLHRRTKGPYRLGPHRSSHRDAYSSPRPRGAALGVLPPWVAATSPHRCGTLGWARGGAGRRSTCGPGRSLGSRGSEAVANARGPGAGRGRGARGRSRGRGSGRAWAWRGRGARLVPGPGG